MISIPKQVLFIGSFKYKILQKHHRTWQNYPKYVRSPKILPSYTNFFKWKTTLTPKYVRFPKNHTLLTNVTWIPGMNLIHFSHYARTVLDCEKGSFLRFWMYIRSRQNAELAFRALGLQLHIAITELLKKVTVMSDSARVQSTRNCYDW